MKRIKYIATILITALICCFSFVCYASEITIKNVSFEKYTDANGIENDANIVMKIEFDASAQTSQIAVCVLGENVDDIVSAETGNKLIYMSQYETPSDGILMIPLSKSAILTATGKTSVGGTTIYLKIGGKTVADMVTKEVTVAIPESEVIKGDVTGEGEVDIGDAIKILRYDAGLETLTDNQLVAGEVTGDGVVDIGDAIKILRYDAGLISTLK